MPKSHLNGEAEAFRVVGIPSDNGVWELEDAGDKAIDYWEKLGPRVHEILDLMDGSEPAGLLGVQFCRNGAFDCYMACVATDRPWAEGPDSLCLPHRPGARSFLMRPPIG